MTGINSSILKIIITTTESLLKSSASRDKSLGNLFYIKFGILKDFINFLLIFFYYY